MKPEEAQELRIYLADQLVEHGFSTILEQANRKLREKFEYEADGLSNLNDFTPEKLLVDFLAETIAIFKNYSNENYGKMIAKINKNLNGEKIEGITVEVPGELEDYDLSNLPNYQEIYHMLGMVRENILKDR